MNVEIQQTILVEEHESVRTNTMQNKMMCALCCFNLCRPESRRPTKQFKKKRHVSHVRFREPCRIEPIDDIHDRQPSWESYRSWTSPELDEALEAFIYQTLNTVRKSLYEDIIHSDKSLGIEKQVLDKD